MQYWLKATSSLILCLFFIRCTNNVTENESFDNFNESVDSELILLNDNEEPTTTEEIQSVVDELMDSKPNVSIDSTNHKKFLTKNGYDINWNILSDVVMDLTYFPEHQASGYYAEFGSSPLFLKEKDISIEGYVVPFLVDTLKNEITYVLSQNPKSACFFCGASGPESVMELILKPGHRNYREDEYLKFKGNLVLNNGNPYRLNYLLYQAEEIEY